MASHSPSALTLFKVKRWRSLNPFVWPRRVQHYRHKASFAYAESRRWTVVVSSATIDSLLKEKEGYRPPKSFRKNGWINDPKVPREAAADRERTWADRARNWSGSRS